MDLLIMKEFKYSKNYSNLKYKSMLFYIDLAIIRLEKVLYNYS